MEGSGKYGGRGMGLLIDITAVSMPAMLSRRFPVLSATHVILVKKSGGRIESSARLRYGRLVLSLMGSLNICRPYFTLPARNTSLSHPFFLASVRDANTLLAAVNSIVK